MPVKRFSPIVGSSGVSENIADRKAYSHSAGPTEAMPKAVLWPSDTEQVARIFRETNQIRDHLVLRGAGTSLSDGCIGGDAIIISSERMNKILNIDTKNKLIEVQSGVRLSELKQKLIGLDLELPFTYYNESATIGGLIAIDAAGKESESMGRFSGLVEEVEFVDGTGKVYQTFKTELVAGKEGITGFITKAKLCLGEITQQSADIMQFDEKSELLRQVRILKKEKEARFIEFYCRSIACELGFENKYLLIIGYNSTRGKIKTVFEISELKKKMVDVFSGLRKKRYHRMQDPSVSLEKTYDLIEHCEKRNIPLHGHIGLGLFYAHFLSAEQEKELELRGFLKGVGGSFGRMFGIGTSNLDFVTQDEKKKLLKLKEEHDYNNTLNANKVIIYR